MPDMRRFLPSALLGILSIFGSASGCNPASGDTRRDEAPLVIELFTSQGCSSCPAADKLLDKLARDGALGGRPLAPLAFHVDYWDDLGWPDPFALPAWTARQQSGRGILGFTERPADQVVDAALEWLGSAPPRFFLWVHLYDPHSEYRPPPGFASLAEPASTGESSVHRSVPEDSIAIPQELVGNRVELERRQLALVTERGIQHVFDVEELAPKQRRNATEIEERARGELHRECRCRAAAVMKIRALVARLARHQDEASRHPRENGIEFPKQSQERRPEA